MTSGTLATYNGGLSNAFENMIINHIFRSASQSGSSCYLALYTSYPDDTDSGIEVSGGGYTRMNISGSFSINWFTGSAAMTGSQIWFPDATSSWGRVLYWGIRNWSTGGSLLIWGSVGGMPDPDITVDGGIVDYGRFVGEGERFMISASNLRINIGDCISASLTANLLDHYLNNHNYHTPYSFLGLYTNIASGSVEISPSGYQRVLIAGSVPDTTGSFSASGGTGTANGTAYNTKSFTITTNATTEWGEIDGIIISSSRVGGYTMFNVPFAEPKMVYSNDGFAISANYLKINIE